MKRLIAVTAILVAGLVPSASASTEPQARASGAYLYKGEAARQLGAILREYYYDSGGARGLDIYWDTRFHRQMLGGYGTVFINGYLRCGRFYVREVGHNTYYRARWKFTC